MINFMGIGNLLQGNQIDQKFSWSFFGVVLSIAFGIFGVYTTIFYERHPNLSVQLLDISPVYSLSENVSKLDIIFDGADIRKNHQTLTLVTIRLLNNGNAELLKNAFDGQHLPKIITTNSQIIKVDVTRSTSSYLAEAAEVKILSNSECEISPVMLDAGESFDLKFLLLHEADQTPKIATSGKVAGIPPLAVINLIQRKNSESFWAKAIGGTLVMQGVRTIIYFGGTLIGLIFISIITAKASSAYDSSRRKSAIRRFKSGSGIKFSGNDEKIFEAYVENGELFLLKLSQFLSDELTLKAHLAKRLRKEEVDDKNFPQSFSHIDIEEMALEFLLNESLIKQDGDKCVIDCDLKKNIEKLVISLSIFAPTRMKAAWRTQQSFGSDTNPVEDMDAPLSNKDSSENNKS